MDFKVKIAFTKEENGREVLVPISKVIRKVKTKQEAIKKVTDAFEGFTFEEDENGLKGSIKVLDVERIPEIPPVAKFNYYDFYEKNLIAIGNEMIREGKETVDFEYRSIAFEYEKNGHKYKVIPHYLLRSGPVNGFSIVGNNFEIQCIPGQGVIKLASKGKLADKNDEYEATYYRNKRYFLEDSLETSYKGNVKNLLGDKSFEALFENGVSLSDIKGRKNSIETFLNDFPALNREHISEIIKENQKKIDKDFYEEQERLIREYNEQEKSNSQNKDKIFSRED